MKFIKLYHECLSYLQSEVKEKKMVLDSAQLAFMTADPGLVQLNQSSLISAYRTKKQPKLH